MHVAVFKYNKSFASWHSKLLFLFTSWLVLQNFGVWFDIYMKRGNRSDGGHDKITWQRIRDLLNKESRQRNSETWWRRTTTTLLGVSFGTYRRRRGYVPLRRLGDVPARCCWVFHLRLSWDVVKTYWWDVFVTSSWDVVTTFQ